MIRLNSTDELNGLVSLTQTIDSLEQLKEIAPILINACKLKGNNINHYDFNKIGVKISPKVFDQYLKERNFMGEQTSSSLLGQILCRSSSRENQLRIAQQNNSDQYKKWSEMIITIYGNQQKTLAKDENSNIDYNTFQDEKEEKKDRGKYKRDDKKQKYLDNEYDQDLLSQFNELNKKNESLSTELQLNNLLCHFIIAQQQKEDNTNRWKERLLQVILLVTTGLCTYYASADC